MSEKKPRQNHTLPSPSANFTLPSLFDDLEVDCRLYFPRLRSDAGVYLAKGCAVFAHPYAPLGGCYDDPVVNSVGSVLLKQGYILVTFNFRGAEGSPGKTSWSGRAELGDFTSIYAFCLSMLNMPELSEHMSGHTRPDSNNVPIMLLGGYSYGSMMAAHLPDVEVVRECLQQATDGSPEKEIEIRAHELGTAFLGFCEVQQTRGRNSRKVSESATPTSPSVTVGGYNSPDAARRISRDRSRRHVEVERVRHSVERVRRKLGSRHSDSHMNYTGKDEETNAHGEVTILPEIRYLLVSPLLGSVASLATMFSRLKFERRGSQAIRDLPQTTPEEVLSKYASLVVYGTADHFTSSAKVKAWCSAVQTRNGSQLRSEAIQGAGHFWHDPKFENQLTGVIDHWLESLGE